MKCHLGRAFLSAYVAPLCVYYTSLYVEKKHFHVLKISSFDYDTRAKLSTRMTLKKRKRSVITFTAGPLYGLSGRVFAVIERGELCA